MKSEYWEAVPRPQPTPREAPPALSAEAQAIEDAIARGDEIGHQLITARDKLFPAMREIYRLSGRDGLMACALGVQLAILKEADRK